MAITITWAADGGTPTTLTVNDAAEASLNSFRQSLPTPPADILTMVLATLTQVLFIPAFGAFPPSDVKTAQTAATTAQQASTAAMQTFVQSAVAVAPPTQGA